MPRLQNRRHEWFAYFRAHDYRLEEAYERAGYPPDRGNASRLASRPDVAMRINELRCDFTDVPTARHPEVVEAVMTLARRATDHGGASGFRLALNAYRLASDLQTRMVDERARDYDTIERNLKDLDFEERYAGVSVQVDAAGDPGPWPAFEDYVNGLTSGEGAPRLPGPEDDV
jgi:hypothetical protein